jgi:hypothetical protein
MFQPDNGKPIPDAKTIVKVVYDNDAIYIAALLYDDEPTKNKRSQLEMILVPRMLWRFINGFNDGQQDFHFCKRCRWTGRLYHY